MNNYAIVTLKKGQGKTIKSGGMWIFDNEIDSIAGGYQNGDLVVIHDFDGFFMGIGFINMNSKIAIRLMTRRKDQEVDDEFIMMRVKNAWNYRKKVIDTSSCRMIFGEADFLPGLIVDKFSDVLVVQSLAMGIDRFKLKIVESLKAVMKADGINIRGVYERSDAKVRKNEGMERIKGFIGDEFDTDVEIIENDVKYIVDVKNGQKTGFFLDQKCNREAIKKLCRGATVLDCFTHTGSFALNAGVAEAKHVLGVDASDLAIARAKENAKLNGLDQQVDFVCADVFDLLPQLYKDGEVYDVVILDPPAFSKSRNSIKNAIKGYREINLRRMKLVKDGGFLVTCSCSHFMSPELLMKTIHQAAGNVHKMLRQVEFKTQSPDHPILWTSDESYYLKFYIFQVCSIN